MKYCVTCVQPDTRPGINFDHEGVCSACRAYKERMEIDWSVREDEIKSIAEWARNRNAPYDCVVGISGGKDSHVQALYAKEELGLNALLVNCAPDNISEVGQENLENLVQCGFDMISLKPNTKVQREVARMAYFEHGNFVKPLEYPLYASAYLIADRFDIPLVIQGENPAETLGIEEYVEKGGDAMQWANSPTVAGGNASDWIGDGIDEQDMRLYQFPSIDALKEKGVKAIFLGHYLEAWSNSNNTEFAVSRGLRGRPEHDPMATGRLNKYFSIDVELKLVNQFVKYLKFGFGAVTDEVCYDIREGRITREDALELVRKYDGAISERYIQQLVDYLGITMGEFWAAIDKFVNHDLFYKDPETGNYRRRFVVGEGL